MAETFTVEAMTERRNLWGFNREDCESTYFLFIKDQICFLLEHEGKLVGAIAFIEARHLMNYSFHYAMEVMFYVEQGHRGMGAKKLLKAVEEEAKARGISEIIAAHTVGVNERIGGFYEACGYRLFEKQYVKDLTNG